MNTKTLPELQHLYPKVHCTILEEIAHKDLIWIQKIQGSVKDKEQMIRDIIKIREVKN